MRSMKSGNYETVDEVVFAEDGDLPHYWEQGHWKDLTPAWTRVNKRLVAAGPIPAAGNIQKQ